MNKRHSPEYTEYINSEEWKRKSRHCRSLTGDRCTLFHWLRANHAHHLTYRNLRHELPGRDIIPLSEKAHKMIHHPALWNKKVRWFVNFALRFQYYVTRLSFILGQMVGKK